MRFLFLCLQKTWIPDPNFHLIQALRRNWPPAPGTSSPQTTGPTAHKHRNSSISFPIQRGWFSNSSCVGLTRYRRGGWGSPTRTRSKESRGQAVCGAPWLQHCLPPAVRALEVCAIIRAGRAPTWPDPPCRKPKPSPSLPRFPPKASALLLLEWSCRSLWKTYHSGCPWPWGRWAGA